MASMGRLRLLVVAALAAAGVAGCAHRAAAGSAVAARIPGPAGAPFRRRSAGGSLPATLVRRARRRRPRLRSTWRRLRLQLKRARALPARRPRPRGSAALALDRARARIRSPSAAPTIASPRPASSSRSSRSPRILPHGFDVNAHYLVDTITSASAAAGTSVDNIFTEIRNEVGLGFGKTWDRTRATLSYKYSAESDYWSHAFWASLSRTLLGQHGDGRRLRRTQPRLGRIPHPNAELSADAAAEGARADGSCPEQLRIRRRRVHAGPLAGGRRAAQSRHRLPRRLSGQPLPAGGGHRVRGLSRPAPADRGLRAERRTTFRDRNRPPGPVPLLPRLLSWRASRPA